MNVILHIETDAFLESSIGAGHLPQQRWSSQVAQQTQQLHPQQQRYMQQRIQHQQRPQGPPIVQGQTQQWIVQESGMKHMQQPVS